MSRGIDESEVIEKGPPSIISVEDSMKMCTNIIDVKEYLIRMSNDLLIRLDEDNEEYNRRPTRLQLKTRFGGGYNDGCKFSSVGTIMPQDAVVKSNKNDRAILIASCLLGLFKKQLTRSGGINENSFHLTGIGCSASSFQKSAEGQRDLRGMMMKIREIQDINEASQVSPKRKRDTEGVNETESRQVMIRGAFFQCFKCGKTISKEEEAEHEDYHFALSLSSGDSGSGSSRRSNMDSEGDNKQNMLSRTETPSERMAKRIKKKKSKNTLLNFIVAKKR
jgi:hypothetical protein